MPSDSRNKYIVAVSGGVDSVVLLYKMLQEYMPSQLVVAHVDHGIREDSRDDAMFVEELAREYGCEFRLKTLQLGEDASEQTARDARYNFLQELAREYDALIYTAHHADDVVESIAINLTRGTGWRGVAVMNTAGVMRPLTRYFKSELIKYAKDHDLQWHEDSTNKTDKYLRNRLRTKLTRFSIEQKLELLALWSRQKELTKFINDECRKLVTNERHFYIMSDDTSAEEVLRQYMIQHDVALTRPQLRKILVDVKTRRAGNSVDLSAGARMKIDKRTVHIINNQ